MAGARKARLVLTLRAQWRGGGGFLLRGLFKHLAKQLLPATQQFLPIAGRQALPVGGGLAASFQGAVGHGESLPFRALLKS